MNTLKPKLMWLLLALAALTIAPTIAPIAASAIFHVHRTDGARPRGPAHRGIGDGVVIPRMWIIQAFPVISASWSGGA